jgi:hypothetical protein
MLLAVPGLPRINSASSASIGSPQEPRWVGTERRELCDRTLIWNQRQLQQLLREYVEHYNAYRPHRSLGQRAPTTAKVVEYRPVGAENSSGPLTCGFAETAAIA